jgi:hypothetical protein
VYFKDEADIIPVKKIYSHYLIDRYSYWVPYWDKDGHQTALHVSPFKREDEPNGVWYLDKETFEKIRDLDLVFKE